MSASQRNLLGRIGRTAATLAITLFLSVPVFAQVDPGPLAGAPASPKIIGTCDTGQPVEVEATAGTLGPSSYATLKLAFDAINAGTHQGAINIEVCASTVEGTTPATLNSSGAGTAAYTSVSIRPLVDGLSISGNPATGLGVIQLKGADNVTIDGDNPNSAGTNRNLTIANTNTTTAIAGSVIRIATAATVVTSADNNTIRNLVLNGNVTGGNLSTITSATGSSNSSFVIYAGGNGGATATDAPTAITSVTTNSAPTGTTINNLVISNNALNQAARAVVFNGASAAVASSLTISNNVIGTPGALVGAPPFAAPATTVYTKGIWIAGANGISVSGNTMQNILSFVATTMTAVELTAAIGASVSITNNTVVGLVNNGSTSIAKGIQISSATGNYVLAGNTVSNVQSSANASGTAGIDVGGTVTSALVERNQVSTVYNRNAGAFGAWGLSVGAGTAVTVRNNFIRDVNANMTGGGAFSTTFGLIGLRIAGGTAHQVLNNSVSLSGALLANGTTVLTAACTIVGTGQTGIDMRNNICANTMTGSVASTSHVSLFLPAAGTSAMNLTLNNNDYFSGPDPATQGIAQVGTVFGTGFFLASNFNADATTPATNLRSYTDTLRAATGNDNASIVADPLLVSATDLHIAVGSPAQNAGATIASVTNDIDQQLRPGGAGYDIGADEVDGVTPPTDDMRATALLDPPNGGSKPVNVAFSPQASFTNNGTTTQTNVTVRYRIINSSAVEVYNQTASIASINFNQTINVTFPPATLATAGMYTTFARSELAGDSNPANDEISGTLNILAPLAGTYTVGTGGNFTSLTNTGGVFQTLNSVGASGNLTINIISDLGAETGTNALNEIAGGFAVRIQPSGSARVVSGSSSTALVTLNGADNVTIDGSLTGGTAADVVGGDSALRNLTIMNTNPATATSVVLVSSGATGAQNVSLRNFNAFGQDPTTTLIGISIGGATAGSAGTDNDNARVENCSVQRAILGIYSTGASAANPNTGNFITKNDISATGVNRVRRGGILSFNQDGIEVSLNQIGGMDSTESIDTYGIGLGIQDVNATAAANGGITNALVTRNRVNGVASVSAVGFSSFGIGIAGGTTGPNTISNNMISGVIAPSTSPDFVSGIFVAGVTGSSTRVYYNSVGLSGDRGAVASQIGSFGFAMSGADPTVELKDNIFSNTQISGGGANARTYAIGTAATTFVNFDANFNLYFASGANAGFFRSGGLGATATDYATLAAWQAAISDDPNSQFADPLFVSTSDLHLQSAPPSPAIDTGTPIASVTVDIDGQPRPATLTDIGADEFVVANTAPTITAVGVTRRSGDTASNSTIANVSDAEDAEDALVVTVNGGATATVTGVTVSGISTTAAGVVSANVIADCTATTAMFTLRATDSGGLFNESTLTVTVDPNLPPTLSYAAANAVFGQSLSVNPATGPSDSGSVASVVVQSPGTYAGGVSVNAAGVVSLTSAAPVGSHTIVIRATDNCAAITDANLALTVGKASSTTTIVTDTPDPSVAGTNVTVTFTVVDAAPGAGTPTGNVTVGDGVDSCTATVAQGQCVVALNTPGNRTLTATYAGDGNFNPSNDTEPHVVTGPTTDLAITKTSNTSMFGSNLIQYTVTARNLGPLAVTGATVQDTLPPALAGATWTCSGTGGGTCTAFGGGDINQLVNLPVNATVTFLITSNLGPNLPDSLVNTATVTSSASVPDSDTSNNSATVTDRVVLFRDGFEGAGPIPFVTLPQANRGETRTQSLPVDDIATMAIDENPVYVIEFRIGNSRALVSTRLLGDVVQVSLLQRNAAGIWSAGPWLALREGQRLNFAWSNVDTAEEQGELRSRLEVF